MKNYKAWIPNVSGVISFSNIKGSLIPRRVKAPHTINGLDGQEPLISYQERNLSDKPNSGRDKADYICYLLVAKAEKKDGANFLCGNILAYAKEELADVHKESIKAFCNESLPSNIRAAAWRELQESWVQNTEVCINISFELEENGIVTLQHEREQNKENTPTNKPQPNFVLEAFSFLKDLVHSHKFHNSDHDSIVVPYLQTDKEDVTWLDESAKNIHKAIVCSYRNARRSKDIKSAIGMLAYLTSLQNTGQKIGANGSGKRIDVDSLKASLEAKRTILESQEKQKSSSFSLFLPMYFAFIGIILSMTQLLQTPCIAELQTKQLIENNCVQTFHLQEGAISFVKNIFANWIWWVLGSSLMSFILYSHHRYYDIFEWIDRQWSSNLFGDLIHKVFNKAALDRKQQIIITIEIAVLLVLIPAFLGYMIISGGMY